MGKLTLHAYENGDHSCLVWFPVDLKPLTNCRGFAVHYTKFSKDGKKQESEGYLRNYTPFKDGDDRPPAGQEWKWPIQRYLWWDYAVQVGDSIQYRVIPVVGSYADGTLALDESNASEPSNVIEITGQASKDVAAYFNRGIIATQWVTRELTAEEKKLGKKAPKTALLSVIQKPGDTLRNALSGLVRPRLLDALAMAAKGDSTVYAALYELNDPELLAALKKLGKRAHIILANGAFNKKKPDENKAARQELKKLHTVEVVDRMVAPGHFAHNKFAVICDKQGANARSVITGSTNWTLTGLCTQANNGLFIDDPKVAASYRKQWDLLKEAKNGFPPSLKEANSVKKTFTVDDCQVTVWFAPTTKQQDMDDARRVVNAAQDGILFLFFNPGTEQSSSQKWTLLQSVLNRHNSNAGNLYDPNLYIRGVVNQNIAGLTEGTKSESSKMPKHPVVLHMGEAEPPVQMSKDVLVPAAIKEKYGRWEKELLSAGVMVHSKVVVVDPFGKNPALITGSHNLGVKASRQNDDNMVIVEGPGARQLAIAYALNIISIFDTYRFRHYAATHPGGWHNLQDNDQWQTGHLTTEKRALEFWAGKR